MSINAIRATLDALKQVYQGAKSDADIFRKAYAECVGGYSGCPETDERLFRNGDMVHVPDYLVRACRNHDVQPAT